MVTIISSDLRTVSSEYEQFKSEYNTVQQSLVEKIVEVALTYIPLFNIFSSLIAQLDVLASFAEVSSSAVIPYTRPAFLDIQNENCMNMNMIMSLIMKMSLIMSLMLIVSISS